MSDNTQKKDTFSTTSFLKIWVAPVLLGGLMSAPILYSNAKKPISEPTKLVLGAQANPLKKLKEELPSSSNSCTFTTLKSQCFITKKALCDEDLKAAKIAWKYFENNYQEKTGLFNAADKYPSTTMWDTGSALAATIAARDFGFISNKDFDDKITALIKTLVTMKLFNNEAPNKVYNTKNMKMVTYANKAAPDGIGVSALDLARLVSWLETLSCKHPKFRHQVDMAIKRWSFDRLIEDGQMITLKRDLKTGEVKMFQEGRLGYEQYAAKILQRKGLHLPRSSTYNNDTRQDVAINGLIVATDNRTPEKFHSDNSVVTESYVMDAIENGYDEENQPLIDSIYQVQKRRWQQEGIVTAVSEDNINKKPYFVYNTIFSGGKTWVAKSPNGDFLDNHKTVSTKAAIALATLYPNDDYSAVLIDKVKSAYDSEKGWYSGVYESGEGYNTSITANTNGVILSSLLYKKYGSTHQICSKCNTATPIIKMPNNQTCGVEL